MYESERGVVSSRRWEAFREGVEDHALLAAFSKVEVKRLLQIANEPNFDQWEGANLEAVRRVLLDGSLKPLSHGFDGQ